MQFSITGLNKFNCYSQLKIDGFICSTVKLASSFSFLRLYEWLQYYLLHQCKSDINVEVVSLLYQELWASSSPICWTSFELDEITILFIELRNLANIHPLLVQIIQQFRCFLQASTAQRYHNKWFSDEAWRKIIANEFGGSCQVYS